MPLSVTVLKQRSSGNRSKLSAII